jgi:hypothetical protein
MKKVISYLLITLLSVFFVIILIQLNTSEENIKVSGTIKSISEGGVKDLVFELENDKISYYVNRGLENGFDLEKSRKSYLGKKAVVNYTKSWTPLASFGTTSKNITQIAVDNKIIYSEFK